MSETLGRCCQTGEELPAYWAKAWWLNTAWSLEELSTIMRYKSEEMSRRLERNMMRKKDAVCLNGTR